MITKVLSSTGNGSYTVDTMELSCTCPHYMYRLIGTGKLCKHIQQVLDSPSKFKEEGIVVVNNSEDLLKFIKANNNDAVVFVEQHSEEDLNKLKLTGQVFERHGILTVLE